MSKINPIDLLDVNDKSKIVNVRIVNNKLIVIIKQGSYLGDALNFMPYGIVNKNVTGIGATTLELESKRHSIIVVPTKALAYGKYNKNKKDYFYLGSPITGKIGRITSEDIEKYIDRKNIHHKFVVVADSLPTLIKTFEKKGIDVYNEYFLMIDEVDIIQSDVTYRPALEDAIDYYLRFKQENRCLVSATIREFSHPVLQKERMVVIDYQKKVKRTIEAIHTNNINQAVSEKISELLSQTKGKILIAYNYITEIHKVIKLLKAKHEYFECGILCSEASIKSAGEFYTELNIDKLIHRVTFMTCAYFVGVDIEEECHVVSVSTIHKPFTLLSANRLTQIKGRCRKGVLSESFIFNIFDANKKVDINDFSSMLLEKAKNIKVFYDSMYKISDEPNIVELFDVVKAAIQKEVTGKIVGEDAVPLTRKDIDDNYVESFFNIDALSERKELKHNIFIRAGRVLAMLRQSGAWYKYLHKEFDTTDEQEKDSDEVDQMQREKKLEDLRERKRYVDNIGDYTTPRYNPLEPLDMHLSNLIEIEIHERSMPREIRSFYDTIYLYRKYYPIKYVTQITLDLALSNERKRDNVQKALIFKAMDTTYPFKQMIMNEFTVGQYYFREEVIKKMGSIYSSYPTPIEVPKDKIIVEHFNLFMDTNRPKKKNPKTNKLENAYEVIDYGVKEIEGLGVVPNPISTIKLTDRKVSNIYDLLKLT